MLRCKTIPYEGKEGYIFISYSHKDSARVFPVIERLDAAGYRIWFDEGIDPGSEWPETVASHLNDSAVYVCFISENFLESQNCRRELNFALRKEITFLSVFLEEAEMPLGIEMQITANQAIMKYAIPTEEEFYRKLFAAKALEAALRPQEKATPAEAPAQKEPPMDEPAKKEPPEEAPAPKKARGDEKSKPAKQPKTKPPRGKKAPKAKKPGAGKKIAAAAAAIFAVLLAALILPGVISSVKNKNLPPRTDLLLSGIDDAEVCKNIRLFLYGDRVWENRDTAAFVQRLNSESYRSDVPVTDPATGAASTVNISALPYGMRFGPEHDNALLVFYDRVGTQFFVEGVPAANQTEGTITFGAPAKQEYENSMLLAGELRYEFAFTSRDLTLKSNAPADGKTYVCAFDALAGELSGPDALRGDVSTVSAPDLTEGAAAEIGFSDGGHAVTPTVTKVWKSLNSIRIGWEKEERLYNGSFSTLGNAGSAYFDYVNTAPYGFIAINGGKLYFYQTPLAAPEDTQPEDTQPEDTQPEDTQP